MQNIDIRESFSVIPSLVFPINLACNLQCFGCNAGSNWGIKDQFTNEQRLTWIDNLASVFDRFKLHTDVIEIVGGEPFMNKSVLEILRHVRNQLPKTKIQFFTNGLLIEHNVRLLSEFRDLGVFMAISLHDARREHLNKITSGILRLKENGISYTIKNMTETDLPEQLGGKSLKSWVIPHMPDQEGKIHPHNEEKYLRSWSICTSKTCPNIYDNAIWKCGPTASLRNLLRHSNQLDDAEWQPYLAYKPLRLDDPALDYDTVLEFFSRGPEPVCSMCPAQNTFYAGKPVYRREYDQFDQKNIDHKTGF